ncbi:MAG: DUF4405 domain-containing protein [Pirellulales bacterium]|nr:DUF4405 domain-containing protein [Pirellulales bacterium]
MSKFNVRGFIAFLLSFAFLLIVISGLILWLATPPRDLSGPWLIFGMTRGAWKHLHIWIGLTMLVVGVIHLILNWSIYWCYLWNRTNRRPNMIWELLLALLIAALIVGSALWEHPPGGLGGRHGSGPGGGAGSGHGGGPHGQQKQLRLRGGHGQ